VRVPSRDTDGGFGYMSRGDIRGLPSKGLT